MSVIAGMYVLEKNTNKQANKNAVYIVSIGAQRLSCSGGIDILEIKKSTLRESKLGMWDRNEGRKENHGRKMALLDPLHYTRQANKELKKQTKERWRRIKPTKGKGY